MIREKENTMKRKENLRVHQPVPVKYSAEYEKYKHLLNDRILKENLTVDNYKEKFHHLLCHEEEEHARQLAERYVATHYDIIC